MKRPKNNKIILILSLLLVFIIMGAASAATDDNVNDTVSSDNSVIQSQTADSGVYCNLHPGEVAHATENICTQAESDTLGAVNNDENNILSNSPDDASFTELDTLINGGGNIVELTQNYTYKEGDSKEGINISKDNIIINGNGYTINGNNISLSHYSIEYG